MLQVFSFENPASSWMLRDEYYPTKLVFSDIKDIQYITTRKKIEIGDVFSNIYNKDIKYIVRDKVFMPDIAIRENYSYLKNGDIDDLEIRIKSKTIKTAYILEICVIGEYYSGYELMLEKDLFEWIKEKEIVKVTPKVGNIFKENMNINNYEDLLDLLNKPQKAFFQYKNTNKIIPLIDWNKVNTYSIENFYVYKPFLTKNKELLEENIDIYTNENLPILLETYFPKKV